MNKNVNIHEANWILTIAIKATASLNLYLHYFPNKLTYISLCLNYLLFLKLSYSVIRVVSPTDSLTHNVTFISFKTTTLLRFCGQIGLVIFLKICTLIALCMCKLYSLFRNQCNNLYRVDLLLEKDRNMPNIVVTNYAKDARIGNERRKINHLKSKVNIWTLPHFNN